MLDKLSARERNLLVVLLGVVLICIVYFGIGKYLYPKFLQVKENLHLKKQELMEVSGRINQLSFLENENSELKIKLQDLTNSFNKEVRNGINYYYIGKHAGENGVTIREMKPLPYEDNKEYLKIPLELTVRGKYRQIIKFIELVEKDMPNTSEIISLEIYPAGTTRPALPKAEEKVEKAEETEKEGSLTESLKETAEKAVTSHLPPEMLQELSFVPDMIGEDPDVDAYMTLVTYAVKSPEIMELAGDKPLGRLDAFTPAIDLPAAEPDMSGEDLGDGGESGGFDNTGGLGDMDDVIFPEESGTSSHGTSDVNESPGSSKGGVPGVIIKETGDYSFPVRETNRDKEETGQ